MYHIWYELADGVKMADGSTRIETLYRDGQLRSMLINELEIHPKKLVKIVHYDGTPITARFIAGAIGAKVAS